MFNQSARWVILIITIVSFIVFPFLVRAQQEGTIFYVHGYIPKTGNVDFWDFNGTAGEKINVCILPDWAAFTPELSLLDRNSNILALQTINHVLLPYTGTYTVRVGSSNGWGSYQLQVVHAQEGAIFACIFNSLSHPEMFCASGCTDMPTIAYGQTITDSFDERNHVDIWSFDGNVGDTVTITMEAHALTFEPLFWVSDPAGNILGFGNPQPPGLIAQFTVTLKSTGTHRIHAQSATQPNNIGIYDMSLVLVKSGKQNQSCSITDPQHKAFVDSAIRPAQDAQTETGVPASVTIAQAILESSWGTAYIGDANNYFGIKATTNADGSVYVGNIAIGWVEVQTQEWDGQKYITVTAKFRKYRNMEDSFRDHAYFFIENSRYNEAMKYTNNPNEFARQIANAGYATSPTYADNLIKLMKENCLYQYDKSSRSG